MDIKTITPVNFSCRTTLSQIKPKFNIRNWFRKQQVVSDTFTRTSFNVNKDLEKVKLKEKINEGRAAEVYKTNFDDYVVRLLRGTKFNPKKLSTVNDPNGLILASDPYNTMQLMKYVKGEPLYEKGWSVLGEISKEKYLKEFKKIQNLPDKTFAEYMREIIRIRKNGYDIDSINPNNFLLNEKHIGIVDLEKSPHIVPKLNFNDIDPLVNTYHLRKVLRTMPKKERYKFAGKIKTFCDRMMNVAKKEGYSFNIPNYSNDGYPKTGHLICYLYYQQWNIIKNLIKTL